MDIGEVQEGMVMQGKAYLQDLVRQYRSLGKANSLSHLQT